MSKEIKPIKFKESNVTYTASGCGDLPVYKGNDRIISCWKVPFVKRLKFIFTKKIWLAVLSTNQPPVYIEIDKPFEKQKG